jgi:hypothetical protein
MDFQKKSISVYDAITQGSDARGVREETEMSGRYHVPAAEGPLPAAFDDGIARVNGRGI